LRVDGRLLPGLGAVTDGDGAPRRVLLAPGPYDRDVTLLAGENVWLVPDDITFTGDAALRIAPGYAYGAEVLDALGRRPECPTGTALTGGLPPARGDRWMALPACHPPEALR